MRGEMSGDRAPGWGKGVGNRASQMTKSSTLSKKVTPRRRFQLRLTAKKRAAILRPL